MKRRISILGILLFVLTILLPLGKLFSSFGGYTFELSNVTAFAIVTAVFSICLVILSLKDRSACENGFLRVFFVLLTPLSLVNAVCYIFENSGIGIVFCNLLSMGSCLFLTIKYGKPLMLKITVLVLSVLMIIPAGGILFIGVSIENFGQDVVMKSVESPNGLYYAEVTERNQGALGGNTVVNVYEDKGIDALVFKTTKRPRSVYIGEWRESENMIIYWKDDHCLVIHSVKYVIE